MKLFLMPFLVLTLSAWAGNEGGHGGDPYAEEFMSISETLSSALAENEKDHNRLFEKWKITSKDFSNALQSLRVTSHDETEMFLNGEEVDAINFPNRIPQHIKINRKRWREFDIQARLYLALHEVFGILGIERDHYRASLDFSSIINTITIRKSNLHFVQRFYGVCRKTYPLGTQPACDVKSTETSATLACATKLAQDQCNSNSSNQCKNISSYSEFKISLKTLGLGYCEAEVIFEIKE